MRLTLRTMLAYLDDILEPADRDEIGRKIEDSQFAFQLVQRVRDCTRKTRLPAPHLAGKGMGLDPNTVAEYLDNTLAGERVPDFEKVCLESDVHLAEVAACHQILTMVLGQPAQIDPEMKRRMYQISTTGEPAAAPNLATAAAGDHGGMPDELWVKSARPKPEVPDYLRQPAQGSNWKTYAAVALLALIFVGAITMALGPLDHTHPILGWFMSPPRENQVADNGQANRNQADLPSQSSNANAAPANGTQSNGTQPNGTHPADTNAGAAGSTSGVAEQPKQETDNATPVAPETTTSKSTVVPTPPQTGSTGAEATPKATAESNPTAADRTMPNEASDVPPLPRPAVESMATVPLVPPQTGAAAPTGDTRPRPGDATVRTPQPAAETPDLQPVPVAADVPVGRFPPSRGVVLLKLDAAKGEWTRAASGASLSSGDQLLVLPTYRPTLTLLTGLMLQVPPETMLQMEPPDAKGVPGIKLLFGRLVVLNGMPGAQLRLTAGSSKGTVTFMDAEATLGIEVRRWFPAGANPEAQEAQTAADLYAASGHLDWTTADGVSTPLNAPQRFVLSAMPGGPPVGVPAAPNIPKWIGPEQQNSNDSRASVALADALETEKPLMQVLREMADQSQRRVENRSLAARCLAMVDEFEPLLAVFSDEFQKAMWSESGVAVPSVRAALTRSPATAAKVRATCQHWQGDEEGKNFYRMFLGYTKEQLQNGESAQLVQNLNHEKLAFRVLAFYDLHEIRGATYSYRPEVSAPARNTAFKRWEQDQKAGQIVPREAPPKP